MWLCCVGRFEMISTMEGDPRVSKPRLPKAYTEEQLAFLRSHIAGFETRTRGHVRGDAKKFALDRANEFLVRFGLPQELQGVDEAEPRFREVCTTCFSFSLGSRLPANIQLVQKHSRACQAQTRGQDKAQKTLRQRCALCYSSCICSPPEASASPGSLTWSPTLAPSFAPSSDAPDAGPSSHAHAHTHAHAHAAQQQQTQQTHQQPGPSTQQLQFSFQTAVPVQTVQVPSPATITLNVTPSALRDAFVTPAIDAHTLSSLIQSYVLAHPCATPLTPVVHALFEAATSLLASASGLTAASASSGGASGAGAGSASAASHARTDILFPLLRRFVDACAFFPNTLVHADSSGPLTGPRALLSALRKSSVWAPIHGGASTCANVNVSVNVAGSLSDEMERIKVDRQRRKDHVQWAQIHAAAIELGIVGGGGVNASGVVSGVGVGVGVVGANGAPSYHHRTAQDLAYGVPVSPSSAVDVGGGNTFSEMMARDAVWEPDEVEWVAGIIVLRAIIRTGGLAKKGEWEQLLGAYERRWKEIKDEARQALVTVSWLFFGSGEG